MQKFRDSDIKPFEFSDLKGTASVSKGEFQSFNFNELNGESFNRENVNDETIRSERTFEKKNNFQIDTAVRDSRGLARQEQSDFETKIQDEVNRRLELAFKDAVKQGIEKGRIEGKEEALLQHSQELAAKIEDFAQVIESVKGQNERIIEKNRHEIYEFVKRFTKWIILKEINEKVYLEQLLEKLILELNAKKNLIIKVGKENFAQMPEVIEAVENRVGKLVNVRLEIVPEINQPGIILESENGLIDGSMEGVFQNIDKIFEQVVKHE